MTRLNSENESSYSDLKIGSSVSSIDIANIPAQLSVDKVI